MSAWDLVWIFFMFSALQPLLRQKLLETTRRRLIGRLERQRGSRVILLVHRQESMSFFGFPVFRYIDIHDSEEVLRAIQMTDDNVPIDLILHTPGGLVLASLQIARALSDHKAKVSVFIPHYAMSGGTLVSLAADEIVMCRHSVLGPVDPQIGQYPARSVLKAVAQKPLADIDDQTLILADQAEKAIMQVRESVRELISERHPAAKADELALLLSEGIWTHDYPITFRKAQALGLPVTANMPGEVLELMRLFPQPTRRTPTVEYLPVPRRAGDPDRRR